MISKEFSIDHFLSIHDY